MNLDDETFLTAYLDGELTPRERLAVEEALGSDPRLAARLHELERVRDLVGSLPRPPAPFDLAATIIPQARVLRARPRPWPPSRLDLGLGTAAAVLMAGFVGLLTFLASRDRAPQVVARPAAPPVAVAVAPATPPSVAEVAASVVSAPSDPAPRIVRPGRRRPVAREADIRLAAEDDARFHELIDSPNLKHIFFVTDVVGGRAGEQVERIVDGLPREDATYARVTIAQGIVLDPNHPGEARVFAVAVNDEELRQIHDTLVNAFPDALEEAAPDPAVVTQLADISQVSLRPGTAVASLETEAETRRRITAIKAQEDAADDPETPEERQGPTPEQLHSAPARYVDRRQPMSAEAAEPKALPEPSLAAPERPKRSESTVVLIWVASR